MLAWKAMVSRASTESSSASKMGNSYRVMKASL